MTAPPSVGSAAQVVVAFARSGQGLEDSTQTSFVGSHDQRPSHAVVSSRSQTRVARRARETGDAVEDRVAVRPGRARAVDRRVHALVRRGVARVGRARDAVVAVHRLAGGDAEAAETGHAVVPLAEIDGARRAIAVVHARGARRPWWRRPSWTRRVCPASPSSPAPLPDPFAQPQSHESSPPRSSKRRITTSLHSRKKRLARGARGHPKTFRAEKSTPAEWCVPLRSPVETLEKRPARGDRPKALCRSSPLPAEAPPPLRAKPPTRSSSRPR